MLRHGLTEPRVALLFPAAGRAGRRQAAVDGTGPKEFFYGGLAYGTRHPDLTFGDTWATPDSPFGRLSVAATLARNSIMNFGLVRPRISALGSLVAGVDVALSFTDAFSISLGYYRRITGGRTILAGGFHGLCDMVEEVRAPFRPYARHAIRRGLAGLDFAFFFGPADREEAIRRYGLVRERTFLFPFGVDTDFWCPGSASLPEEGFVFAAGSDPKRDYACLVRAPYSAPTRVLTRREVPGADARSDVEVVRGSFHEVAITDIVLRDFYRAAALVVVPVRDVFQPSGYSVALQAMACGKPVVLSRIKGLWDREVFASGVNCMLVTPGDPGEMGGVIRRLLDDPSLRATIGIAARDTAVKHFALERMNQGLEDLVLTALKAGLVGKKMREPTESKPI